MGEVECSRGLARDQVVRKKRRGGFSFGGLTGFWFWSNPGQTNGSGLDRFLG